MEKADAVYMMPGWEHSKGANAERKEAERHGVPIFYKIERLIEWADALIEAQRIDPVIEAERLINRSDD
jgi:hypothetical protein